MQCLKGEENSKAQNAVESPKSQLRIKGVPRVVILSPTYILLEQLGAVSKRLAQGLQIRTRVLTIRDTKSYSYELLESRYTDLLVATPERMLGYLDYLDKSLPGKRKLMSVEHLVLDEADMLLSSIFVAETSSIIGRLRSKLKSITFVTSTITNDLDDYLSMEFGEKKSIIGPDLHKMSSSLRLHFEPLLGPQNQRHALIELLKRLKIEAEDMPTRVLIFINRFSDMTEICYSVRNAGIYVTPAHSFRNAGDRTDMAYLTLEQTVSSMVEWRRSFAEARTGVDYTKDNTKNTFQVVVATDMLSRGLDTTKVEHVILYDMPFTTTDFLHRCGRASRLGRPGNVYLIEPPPWANKSFYRYMEMYARPELEGHCRQRKPIDWEPDPLD